MAKRGRRRTTDTTGPNEFPPPPDRRDIEEPKHRDRTVDLRRLQLSAPQRADRRANFLRNIDGQRTPVPPSRLAPPPPPRGDSLDDVMKRMESAMREPPRLSFDDTADVQLSCAKTGQRLVVHFKRADIASPWRAYGISRNSPAGPGQAGPATQKLDISNFDFSGARCECGSPVSPIECSCGVLGCDGGKFDYLGAPHYTCLNCKSTGRINHGLKAVDAVKLGTDARTAGGFSSPRYLPKPNK